MSNAQIAAALFRMKRTGQELASIAGELFSVDELLTRLTGNKVSEDVGRAFVADDADVLRQTMEAQELALA